MAIPDNRPGIPQWTLGERMSKARRAAGYSQAKMAALFGVSEATISSWETEARRPHNLLDVLRRWAELCGVDYAWLTTGGGDILTYLDIVDERQLLLPYELPPSRHETALTLVGGDHGADRAAS